jgi:hypothetical protein
MPLTSFPNFANKHQVIQHLWCAKGQGVDTIYVLEVDPVTGAFPASFTPAVYTPVDLISHSYASTNVTTAAYVEIEASTADDASQIMIADSSGCRLILATGAAASEVPLLYIPEGSWEFPIPVSIAAGTRLSIKALDTTATSGYMTITLLG